jgi:hypothetical protein
MYVKRKKLSKRVLGRCSCMCCVFVEYICNKKTLEDHARRSMKPEETES